MTKQNKKNHRQEILDIMKLFKGISYREARQLHREFQEAKEKRESERWEWIEKNWINS